MSNCEDSDETGNEPSCLDLCCLQKPVIIEMAVKELMSTHNMCLWTKKKKKCSKKAHLELCMTYIPLCYNK